MGLNFIDDEAKTCHEFPTLSPNWDVVCSRLTEVGQVAGNKKSRPRIVVSLPTIGVEGTPRPSDEQMRTILRFVMNYEGHAQIEMPNLKE